MHKKRLQLGPHLPDSCSREISQHAIHGEGAEGDVTQREAGDDEVAELSEDCLTRHGSRRSMFCMQIENSSCMHSSAGHA